MADTNVALTDKHFGEVRKHKELRTDGDGKPIDRWLQRNADMAGKTKQQWLDDAVSNLKAKGYSVPDKLEGADDVKGYLDGYYDTYKDAHNGGSDQIWKMWQDAGAKYDSSWQYKTSLHRDTGEKKDQKVWDLNKKAWVIKKMPVREELDPDKIPYVVSNLPKGTIVRVTVGDNPAACAIVGDHGTNELESSPKLLGDAGVPLNGKDYPTGPNAYGNYLVLGKSTEEFPTAEGIRKDCENQYQEYLKQQEEKKKKAEEKKKKGGKQASAQQQGGVFYLAEAPSHNVAAGASKLLVAVANPQCLHSGNQPVCTGSGTIFAGVEQSPLAREGDLTKDGYVIRKGTGDPTIVTV